jgi:hypothetical protein
MKKQILLCFACMCMYCLSVNAQTKKSTIPPPPPPPTSPIPPPPPPAPPKPVHVKFTPPRIVRDGIDFKISKNNGVSIVKVYKNKKKVDQVTMAAWNAKRKYYEKKYGQLPPPPPPSAKPGKVHFTPPTIKKDNT